MFELIRRWSPIPPRPWSEGQCKGRNNIWHPFCLRPKAWFCNVGKKWNGIVSYLVNTSRNCYSSDFLIKIDQLVREFRYQERLAWTFMRKHLEENYWKYYEYIIMTHQFDLDMPMGSSNSRPQKCNDIPTLDSNKLHLILLLQTPAKLHKVYQFSIHLSDICLISTLSFILWPQIGQCIKWKLAFDRNNFLIK